MQAVAGEQAQLNRCAARRRSCGSQTRQILPDPVKLLLNNRPGALGQLGPGKRGFIVFRGVLFAGPAGLEKVMVGDGADSSLEIHPPLMQYFAHVPVRLRLKPEIPSNFGQLVCEIQSCAFDVGEPLAQFVAMRAFRRLSEAFRAIETGGNQIIQNLVWPVHTRLRAIVLPLSTGSRGVRIRRGKILGQPANHLALVCFRLSRMRGFPPPYAVPASPDGIEVATRAGGLHPFTHGAGLREGHECILGSVNQQERRRAGFDVIHRRKLAQSRQNDLLEWRAVE